MAEEKQGCYGCDHYIASVGEKGYCKLYRHETSLPEMCCPRYEERKKEEPKPKEIKRVEKKTPVLQKNGNFLALAAFFACTVLTVIGLMFGLYFSVTVFSLTYISTSVKVISFFATLAVILFGAFLMFNIGKKYLVARLLELFTTVLVVVSVLINYETIWFRFHNLVIQIIDYFFGAAF